MRLILELDKYDWVDTMNKNFDRLCVCVCVCEWADGPCVQKIAVVKCQTKQLKQTKKQTKPNFYDLEVCIIKQRLISSHFTFLIEQ